MRIILDRDLGVSGGGFRERADELQWRPGTADQTADQLPLPEEGGHVCTGLTPRQTATPGGQSRERKDHHSTTVCPAQTSGFQQEETHFNCKFWAVPVLVM